MQPAAAHAVRSAVAKGTPALWQAGKRLPSAQDTAVSAAVPNWLLEIESKAEREVEEARRAVAADEIQAGSSQAAPAIPDKGVHYNFYMGADLRLFSSSQAESRLKNMHEPNHRELAISKFAARVADFLWPGCQDNIDEAIAKHKIMAARSRVHVPEPAYEPPQVPHLLPFTNWLRNSQELRESFVCDETTRYKPRMAWYNPNDGMVPSGWLTEGLIADLAYYKPFAGLRAKWQAP